MDYVAHIEAGRAAAVAEFGQFRREDVAARIALLPESEREAAIAAWAAHKGAGYAVVLLREAVRLACDPEAARMRAEAIAEQQQRVTASQRAREAAQAQAPTRTPVRRARKARPSRCVTGGNCSSFGSGRSCGAPDCDGR